VRFFSSPLVLFSRKYRIKNAVGRKPRYADYLLILELAGRWSESELWERQLAILADEFNVVPWDFSGFNLLATEKIPASRDKKMTLKWFWEPAHCIVENGDLILSGVLPRLCDEGNADPEGTVITTGNIYVHNMHSRTETCRYKEQYGPVIERLKVLHFEYSQVPLSEH
jgi:hypothetical protein